MQQPGRRAGAPSAATRCARLTEAKAGRYYREFAVVVDIPADDRGAKLFATVLCALHDAGKVLHPQAHRDEEIFCQSAPMLAMLLMVTAALIQPICQSVIPSTKSVVEWSMSVVATIRPVAARQHGAVVAAVLFTHNTHHGL